jgi:hypothetical protein
MRLPFRRLSALQPFSLSFLFLATCVASSAGPVPSGKPAHYPDWWFERDVIPRLPAHATNENPVWPTHYPVADDYAVANLGQLKHIASAAAVELAAKFPPLGADAQINAITGTWTGSVPQGLTRDDYASLNQGQLKAVSSVYYARLVALGFSGQPLSQGQTVPWPLSSQDTDHYAVANLGQLKYIFSFSTPSSTFLDSDNDGLNDSWEAFYFGSLVTVNGSENPDNDTLTNLQEYLAGTYPKLFDSDGDGVKDGWDYAPLNKLSSAPPNLSSLSINLVTPVAAVLIN